MKDIKFKLTAKRQKTELIIFAACFLFAFLLNVYSIISFETEWKELYTQLLWVLSLSIGFYFLVLFYGYYIGSLPAHSVKINR